MPAPFASNSKPYRGEEFRGDLPGQAEERGIFIPKTACKSLILKE